MDVQLVMILQKLVLIKAAARHPFVSLTRWSNLMDPVYPVDFIELLTKNKEGVSCRHAKQDKRLNAMANVRHALFTRLQFQVNSLVRNQIAQRERN